MKRIAILLLVAAMLLASCGTPTPPAASDDTTNAPETTVAPETTAAPETTKAPFVFDVEESILGIDKADKITTTFSADAIRASDVEKTYIAKTDKGFTYISIDDPHFEVSGFPFADVNTTNYFRLESASLSKYSTQVQKLAANCAGARVRFKTNATSIDISIYLRDSKDLSYTTEYTPKRCDVYVGSGPDAVWVKNVSSGTVTLPAGIKEVTILLPMFSTLRMLQIGIPTTSAISSPDPYAVQDPVVIYGSSATHGASASRPGLAYAEMLTRSLGANLVNYGFAEAATSELAVAESIAKIKMSAFVYDCDVDCDIASLKDGHYNFYKTIRDAQPDLPILLLSRFSDDYTFTADEAAERRAIIKDTYDKAVAAGDTNVYFIDDADIFPTEYRDYFFVDAKHPNDLGMYFIANAIYPVLKDALVKSGALAK